MSMNRKLTYEEVRNYINGPEGNGCTLISTEYVNSQTKLEIKCACGEIFYKELHVFKVSFKQCTECTNMLRSKCASTAPTEKSLGYLHPELLKQWDYEKNKDIDPFKVYAGSARKVWWKDKFGNSWQQALYNRAFLGCGYNSRSGKVSKFEQKLANEFASTFSVVNNTKDFGYELDIYFPNYKLAIEYDGYYWHKDKYYRDLEKNKKCFNDGITLVRIRGGSKSKILRPITTNDYQISTDSYIDIDSTIMLGLCRHLYNTTKINKFLDMCNIYAHGEMLSEKLILSTIEVEASIDYKHPELMKDWHWEKNKEYNPKMLTSGSCAHIWWKCHICGYEWYAPVSRRAITGAGCPKCAGNNHMTTAEFIEKAKEIHGDTYDYSKVHYVNSITKVELICKKHNSSFWQIPASHLRGAGCKRCAADLASARYRSTKAQFIEKAKKKHGDKYDYSQVEYVNNHTKIKIICPVHNGSYQTPAQHLRGSGCPKCGLDNRWNTRRKNKKCLLMED